MLRWTEQAMDIGKYTLVWIEVIWIMKNSSHSCVQVVFRQGHPHPLRDSTTVLSSCQEYTRTRPTRTGSKPKARDHKWTLTPRSALRISENIVTVLKLWNYVMTWQSRISNRKSKTGWPLRAVYAQWNKLSSSRVILSLLEGEVRGEKSLSALASGKCTLTEFFYKREKD